MQEVTDEKQVKKPKKKKEYSILQPANKQGRHVNGMLNVLRFFLVPLSWLLFPFKVFGHKKVKDGACIYVCNHYRIWDVVYPALTTDEGIHYLAKSELKKSFIWPFCRAVKLIPLDRNGEDVKSLMDALRCLKNNEKIAIYPEGTRNKTDQPMLPFKSGASMLAIKTKTPIVPVVTYEKQRPFRLNHVIIGEPFELSEYYGQKMTQELLAEADEKLRQRLLDIREEHTKLLESKKKKS
ncbi:MAG: 1-acyl-sn-glycerol-3-phosphate acyltransferase [Clostridia bacterium]|nr:1-acyl-sn-glycerol-3-phosphate acyltransferase [Clostridia bacterium]